MSLPQHTRPVGGRTAATVHYNMFELVSGLFGFSDAAVISANACAGCNFHSGRKKKKKGRRGAHIASYVYTYMTVSYWRENIKRRSNYSRIDMLCVSSSLHPIVDALFLGMQYLTANHLIMCTYIMTSLFSFYSVHGSQLFRDLIVACQGGGAFPEGLDCMRKVAIFIIYFE